MRVRDEHEITYGPVRDEHGGFVDASQVVRKVTQRRRLEAEEADARRLESVGRLAEGVSHDFNKLITADIGYSQLVTQSFAAADPRREDKAQIERAATRAGELTQQLLASLVEDSVRPIAPLLGNCIQLAVRTE